MNNKFCSTVSINDDDFNKTTIPPGAFEIESINNEIDRNIMEEGHVTEANYPFTIKPKFSTLGYFIEISSNITSGQNDFTPGDSIKDLLGFKPKVVHEEYNLSD